MAKGGGGTGDLRRPKETHTGISGEVQRFTGMNGGFGFIIPDQGGKNIFFLASAVIVNNDNTTNNKDDNNNNNANDDDDNMSILKKGDFVTFDTEVEDDFKDQKGKLKAINVMKVIN